MKVNVLVAKLCPTLQPHGLSPPSSADHETLQARILSTILQFWRRKWQPTPVFLPRESHGQRSLASYRPWSHKSQKQLGNKTTTVLQYSQPHSKAKESSLDKRNALQVSRAHTDRGTVRKIV